MVRLFEVGPILWDLIIEELDERFHDTDFQAKDLTPDWRKLAHRRKIDREIFEKYGNFRTIILDPRFQLLKQYFEENGDLSVFVGDPLLPITTAIILLFVLYRKLSGNAFFLLASLLFNVNPLYVVAISLFFISRGGKKKTLPKRFRKSKTATSSTIEKSLSKDDQTGVMEFDHVFLGAGISSLYSAALLAKNGHRVCVVQVSGADSFQLSPPDAPCTVDIEQLVVTKPERYQFLLDAVQLQQIGDRRHWTVVGKEETGFVHSIVRILRSDNHRERIIALRSGQDSLSSELSKIFPVAKSQLNSSFDRWRAATRLFSSLLYSRIKSPFSEKKVQTDNTHDRNFPSSSVDQSLSIEELSPNVRDLLSSLSRSVGLGEGLPSSQLSSLALANLLSSTEGGIFVPSSGSKDLRSALIQYIRQNHGEVFDHLTVRGLEMEGIPSEKEKYRAVAVRLSPLSDTTKEVLLGAKQSVVSGLGLLHTYATLIPHEVVHPSTKESLKTLQERRPRVKVIFWLRGSREELGLSPINYYQVTAPGTAALAIGEKEPVQSQSQSQSLVVLWSPSVQTANWPHRDFQTVVVEYELSESSWLKLEPMKWSSPAEGEDSSGPLFYQSVHDPLSSPNHPDYPLHIGGRHLALSASLKADYTRRAELLLREVYPLCTTGRVLHSHLQEPSIGGRYIANDTAKFEAPLSVFTEVENLFLTGSDLASFGIVGEVQSGWISANAVLGYSQEEESRGENLFSHSLAVQSHQ